MADFEIRGADDVAALVKRINQHADSKALRREMFAGLNRATKGVRAELSEAIPEALPEGGGLAAVFKGAVKFNTTAKAGKWAGVTIWGRARGHDVRTLTGKRLRHPVHGNRRKWVNQTKGVNPNVVEETFGDQKPEVMRDVARVMGEIARKVEG